jgi:hypothetical protein
MTLSIKIFKMFWDDEDHLDDLALLQFLTASGAQQIIPKQKKFPPYPLHPKLQHSGSSFLSSSSLHIQHLQQRRF